MPRNKICLEGSEHISQTRKIKTRLIEISMKVDNYIYKQKPISKMQAKMFLDEISSYNTQCNGDIGYIQVIEKLTKYMKIIISSKTNTTKVSDKSDRINNSENFTPLLIMKSDDTSSTPAQSILDIDRSQDQQETVKALDDANYLNSNKNCATCLKNNQEDEQITERPTVKTDGLSLKNVSDFENLGSGKFQISHISQNLDSKNKENIGIIEINLATDVEGNDESAEIDKLNLETQNKIHSNPSSENTTRVMVHVDREVANENMKPEFMAVNGNQKNIILISTDSEIQMNTHNEVKKTSKQVLGQEQNITEVNDSSVIYKIKKKVNFKQIENRIPIKTEIVMNNTLKGVNSKTDVIATNTFNDFEVSDNLKTKQKKTKKSNDKDEKKVKRNTAKEKIIKICNDKIVKTPNKRKTISKKKKDPNNTHDITINNLSWLDTIKYVREIDAQEYCAATQGIDDNFWKNQAVPPYNDKEFNI